MRALSLFLFLALSSFSWGNFVDKSWTFHGPKEDAVFQKCGGDLGSPLVSLDEIQKKYGLKRIDSKNKKDFTLQYTQGTLKRSVHLSTRRSKVVGDGWETELSQAPEFVRKSKKSQLCVPLDFGDRVLTPLLSGQKIRKWDEHLNYTTFAQVVLDPGHGGNDWGTLGLYKGEALKEKDLTLDYAKEFESKLKEKNISVALTRNQDDFVALTERYALANKLNPKLFLSFHLNSNGISPGFEIFTLSLFKRDRKALVEIGSKISNGKEKALLTFKSAAKQELSIAWAAEFKKTMSKYLKPVAAGMRREPFFLLYAVESPALLLELGSMDREDDLRFWLSPTLRQALWSDLSAVVESTLKQKSN